MVSMTHWQRWVSACVSGLLVVGIVVAPASATVLKLSSQTGQHGNVNEFRISPNGQ
jgi:hypothetical protein